MTAAPVAADPWDMAPILSRSHGTTPTPVAYSLKHMAEQNWCDRCFELSGDNDRTQLRVAQITLDTFDVDRSRPGSLADCLFTDHRILRAMTLPEPGWYVVAINAAGVPTGFQYAGPRDARLDYDYARSRW